MKRFLIILISHALLVAFATSTALGALTASGDVSPTDPSTWTYFSTTGYIGKMGTGALMVNSGSKLYSSYGYLGYNSGTTGTATVSGTGSKWTNLFDLDVGFSGNGTLNIAAGGQVSNGFSSLGYNSGSTGTATVTGNGSIWKTGWLEVGYSGNGTLNVETGGVVSSSLGNLGENSGSTGTATVTGNGSKWTDTGNLNIGFWGNGTLNIEAGGTVSNNYGYVGWASVSTGTATVTGSDSKWTNSYDLNINNGTLNVKSGGVVSNNYGYVDGGLGSTSKAIITGNGSSWTNRNDLKVGYFGNGTLDISSGAAVSNDNGYLGLISSSTGTATVTGSGSMWINSSNLYVGYNGSGTLTVSDGGVVTAQTIYASQSNLFGNGTISSKGAVLDADLIFDGAHSGSLAFGSGGMLNLTLDGSGNLGAAYQGTGTLSIANGLAIKSSYGYVGYLSGSTGTATITGSGSKWINSNDLYVGYNGSGILTVSDGGVVTAQTIYASASNLLGNGTISTNGAVLDADIIFDGTHSGSAFGTGGVLNITMDGTGNLGAGYKGTGTLSIAYGRAIVSSSGYLGYNSGSSGTATITGTGSKWTNTGDLNVGYYGNGTLNIEAGGEVSDNYGYVGSNSTGTAKITDSGSKWTNSADLVIGYSGTGSVTQSSGTNSVGGTLYLGQYSGSNGAYNLNGGALILKSLAQGSGTAAFNFGGGALQASGNFTTSLPMTLTGTNGNANIDTQGYTATLTGALSGTGGLNKLGSGTLTLNATNTYSGDTIVKGGALEIAGGIGYTGTSLVDVQAGKAVFKTTNITKTDLDIKTAASAIFEVQNGTYVIGDISGNGITQVDDSACLTANSIIQDTLTIGRGAKVVLSPIATGRALGGQITPVPEPSLAVLLCGAAMGLVYCWARKGKR